MPHIGFENRELIDDKTEITKMLEISEKIF